MIIFNKFPDNFIEIGPEMSILLAPRYNVRQFIFISLRLYCSGDR